MNDAEMSKERITPYKKKSFASKETLLNIILFFVFIGVTTLRAFLEKKLTFDNNLNYSKNLAGNLGYILGVMIVYGLIGFALAYGIFRKKDKQVKIKYGLLFSIFISLFIHLTSYLIQNQENNLNVNKVVNEQMSDKFHSDNGKYSIMFPEIPKIENMQVDNPQFGKIDMKLYYTSEGKTQYMLTYYDVDEIENWSDEQLRQLLIGVRDGSLGNLNARLIGSSFFIFTSNSKEKYNGINYYGEYKDKNNLEGMIFGRVVFVRNRAYAFYVVAKRNETPKKIIDDFLDSFECYY